MLDSRCWILDIQDHSNSEIEKHPESRCQYPGSANASKGFRRSDPDEMQCFMRLQGLKFTQISTIKEGDRKMIRVFRYILILQFFFIGTPLCACTVFYASQGDAVLAGNNEDWKNPLTKVWFEPKGKSKYGRVFFGFDNFYPQGGMNEKGLFFDVTAAKPVEVPVDSEKPIYNGNLLREKIMPECATVKEALKLFKQYQAPRKWQWMYIIGDGTGDSAIVGPYGIIRKKGSYQVATNFYQSKVKPGEYPCERYKIAADMLAKRPDISVDYFRKILDATHVEGDIFNTVYSNIYDLNSGMIYLYHFHNYQNEVVIDLKKELKKGKHSYALPSLFPKTYAAGSLISAYKKRQALTTAHIDSETYDELIGIYEMPAEIAPKTFLAITRRDDKLYGVYPESPADELLPISDNRFVMISKKGVLNVTFKRKANGEADELVVETEGLNFSAKKIK
jgi:hypothetical protein